MNTPDKDDPESKKKTLAFDPPLVHEEIGERPEPDNDEREVAEQLDPAEIEENKDQSEVITKEAIQRVARGQL